MVSRNPTGFRSAGLTSFIEQTDTPMTLFAPTNAALAAAGLDVSTIVSTSVNSFPPFIVVDMSTHDAAMSACLAAPVM